MTFATQRMRIVRAAIEVIYGSTEPLKAWGPFIFPELFSRQSPNDVDIALQVRIFPIYFCCLRDVSEAPASLSEWHREALRLDLQILAQNVFQVSLLCRSAIELVVSIPEEEQVYLSLLRDRFVHGYLNGPSNESRNLKLATSKGVKRRTFTPAELGKIVDRVKDGSDDGRTIRRIMREHEPNFRNYLSSTHDFFVDVEALENALMCDWILLPDSPQ